MTQLPVASPSQMGVDPKAILGLLNAAAAKHINLNGIVLVRHGHVISKGWYKPYREDLRHMLFSLTKSFMSTAAGFAIQEGLLSLDAPVVSFFPEKLPSPPCANMLAMKVRHLLGMCTGHTSEPSIDEDFIRTFLTSYVPLEPGSRFLYNTAGSCMAGAIIEKATGAHLDEYLKPRLFTPLGIEDYCWERLPGDICTGGYGLSLRTGDIAKFGQFLLQRGQWDGKQLLNSEWVDDATSFHIRQPDSTPDWCAGYGYQFWRCAREDAFRGDGAFGQLCVVLPKHDMVLAVNAGLGDMQEEMDLFFDELTPGLHDHPIPEDAAAQAELDARLGSLSVEPIALTADNGSIDKDQPPRAASLPDAPEGVATYMLADNVLGVKSVVVSLGRNDAVDSFTLQYENASATIRAGTRRWIETDYNREGYAAAPSSLDSGVTPYPLSAMCAVEDGVWHIRVVYTTTPFIDDIRVTFVGGAIRVNYSRNVGFRQVNLNLIGLRQ
ncbi:MAG: beta-lactamase family protein [Oscillospiraceae bacterium]|nr:beta-lactamase family protein [Oscillospiraceae bacterium]